MLCTMPRFLSTLSFSKQRGISAAKALKPGLMSHGQLLSKGKNLVHYFIVCGLLSGREPIEMVDILSRLEVIELHFGAHTT